MTLENHIQEVILPNIPGDYVKKIQQKVVQLRIDGSPVLRFINKDRYHADIVESALREAHVPFKSDSEGVPEPKGDRYEVVGAGKAEFDPAERRIRFYWESLAYHTSMDAEHMKEVAPHLDGWEFEVSKRRR